jgi:hypothetical protein
MLLQGFMYHTAGGGSKGDWKNRTGPCACRAKKKQYGQTGQSKRGADSFAEIVRTPDASPNAPTSQSGRFVRFELTS